MNKNVIIGRQIIVDRNRETVAYEFLYRSESMNNSCSNTVDRDFDDTKILLDNLKMIGTETALNNRFGFFNITEEIMKDVESFDIPKNSVLEIMEFDTYTETMIDSIKNAKNKGYRIALDDFLYRHIDNDLIDFADIIKVDYLDCTNDEIEKIALLFKNKKHILLAEKVETEEMYNHALKHGFELFQGYYFAKPELLSN